MELLRDAVAARVTRARAGHAATEAGATPA
jgi:hypothetical protein